MKTLSTEFTFFHQFSFPVMVLFVGSYALIRAIIEQDWAGITFVIFWLLGCGMVSYYSHLSLKEVKVTEEFLIISNYFKEIKVPLSAISDIRKSQLPWMILFPRIVVQFNTTSPFGKTIRFVPYAINEVISELKQAMSRTSLEEGYYTQAPAPK